MEAIGLVASLINILQGIDAICTLARANIHSSASAKQDLVLLLSKCSLYKGLIEGVRTRLELDDTSQERLSALAYVGGPLDACTTAFNLIHDRLEKLPRRVVFGTVVGKDIQKCLETLDGTLPALQLALQNDQGAILAAVVRFSETTASEMAELRLLSETAQSDVRIIKQMIVAEHIRSQDAAKESTRSETCRWLNYNSPPEHYQKALRVTVPGSGSWFIFEGFLPWLEDPLSSTSQVLWLRGKSGTGKTTLFSLAVDELKTRASKRSQSPFAYFLCSSSDLESRKLSTIIASFVGQVCDQLPQLWDSVSDLRMQLRDRPLQEADAPKLMSILAKAGDISGEIVLLLDGSNESESPDDLVAFLKELSTKVASVRLFISSTEDIKVDVVSNKVRRILMHGRPDDDLRDYLWATVTSEHRLRSLTTGLQTDIVNTIVRKSGNSFRWATCQMMSLIQDARSQSQIKQSLRTLSRPLEELYVDTLCSVPDTERFLVQRALLWLTFAIRPLHIKEIGEIMILKDQFQHIEAAERLFPNYVKDVLRMCRMVIDFNVHTGVVSLAHSSVRDFLLGSSCKNGPAKEFFLDEGTSVLQLSVMTLTYLNLDRLSTGYCHTDAELEERVIELPLAKYASEAWSVYMEDVYPANTQAVLPTTSTDARYQQLEEMAAKFIDSASAQNNANGGNFGAWVQLTHPHHIHPAVNAANPLYYASKHGWYTVLKLILKFSKTIDLELPGGMFQSTPLHIAAYMGHTEAVEVLLAHGASTNETNACGERGVAWAFFLGFDDVVALMMAHGAPKPTIAEISDLSSNDITYLGSFEERLKFVNVQNIPNDDTEEFVPHDMPSW